MFFNSRKASMLKFMMKAAVFAIALTGCKDLDFPELKTIQFDFRDDNHGFSADVTDFHISQEAEIAFTYGVAPLPASTGVTRPALFHEANNVSDDVFLFFKRRVTGLQPLTRYDLSLSLEIASNVGSECISDHVWLKAGAGDVEPLRIVQTDGYVTFNLDKGNQSQVGRDAVPMGTTRTTAPGCDGNRWKLVTRNSERPIGLVTDFDGGFWLWFGSESGFEVAHRLYFTKLTISAQEVRQ
jgi:hypothetical protein